jgi:O-methyltransferase
MRIIIINLIRLFNKISITLSFLINKEYQLLIPYATYAPWIRDKDFLNLYNKVKKNSLVTLFQCWELWKLVEDTKKIEGDIIEIGTYKGASAAVMATKMKMEKSSNTLFCCDTFKGVVKASSKDNWYKGGEHKDVSLESLQNLFKNEFKLDNVSFLIGIFPEDTGHTVEKNKFRLCHIDVDVYLSAVDIIDWIWDRLSVGGVIVFNDYGYPRTAGITKVVNENRERKDCVVIHNLNGNGLMIKTGTTIAKKL